jgi:aryl-alcohol dehydrogenase-like predicted oxidoreductase
MSASTLQRAVKVAPVAAAQVEYSVFSRDIEGSVGENLLRTCRELGVASVVAMPLGRGLLTSDFFSGKNTGEDDMRGLYIPRFQAANRDGNVQAVAKFKVLADKKGCSISQLALAWLLKKGDDIFPIPGTRKIKYVEENWAAQDIVLTDEEEVEIDIFSDSSGLIGSSIPPQFAHLVFRNTKEES